MSSFWRMLDVQSVLLLYILVGIYCRKRKIFDDITRDKLSDFVVKVTLPCMVFGTFEVDFNLDILHQGGVVITIAFIFTLFAFFLGKILFRGTEPETRCVLRYGVLVSNAGFAGLPIVNGVYGSEGLLWASIFIIPTRITMWSAGISLFTKSNTAEGIKKALLNPGMIAVGLGIVRMIFQIELPNFIDTAINRMGDCSTPLAMAIVGAILADTSLSAMFTPIALYLVGVRQILLPLTCLVVLHLFQVDPQITGISVVLTGMPVGSTTAILAQKYGADAQFASKCVFVSTVTSLLTVPLLTLLL